MFNNIYRNRRVLVTGHTGFKGSWLCCCLEMLGAEVCGVALAPDTEPAHFDLVKPQCRSVICDIRDRSKLLGVFKDFQPEIVFHLAAQPLVRRSYLSPVETFDTNVMGTVNLLDCCRNTDCVRAGVIISSDKCYENVEQLRGYRESDPMGGYDPYSASKGCTELVVSAWRRSFFNPDDFGVTHNTLIASARAGNVIGGGDWAPDRLIPDIMRAAASGRTVLIRNPRSVRPWQFVLEPLSGYLLLGMRLYQGDVSAASGWNFGPEETPRCVMDAAEAMAVYWEDIRFEFPDADGQPHEAALLQLDCSKAQQELNWQSVLSQEEGFEAAAIWYKTFYQKQQIITREQLQEYVRKAGERGLEWTR